jgi:hypothetical protein
MRVYNSNTSQGLGGIRRMWDPGTDHEVQSLRKLPVDDLGMFESTGSKKVGRSVTTRDARALAAA